MNISVIGGKPKDFQNFLSQNFGLLMTFGSFGVLVIRLLLLAHGRSQIAIYILAHADKVPLLVGLIIPVVPIFCVLSSFAIVYLWNRGGLNVPSHIRIPMVAIGILLGVVGFWTGRWYALLGVFLFGFVFFLAPAMDLISSVWSRKSDPDQKVGALIDYEKFAPGLALYMFFALCLIFPGPNWLPTECLAMTDKTNISAVVLSSDPKFTYLLTSSASSPLIVITDKIANRIVMVNSATRSCKQNSQNQPKISNAPMPSPAKTAKR